MNQDKGSANINNGDSTTIPSRLNQVCHGNEGSQVVNHKTTEKSAINNFCNAYPCSSFQDQVLARAASAHARLNLQMVLKTIHLSCASHPYYGANVNYAGFILYARGCESEWVSPSSKRKCKSGYLVVQDATPFEMGQDFVKNQGMYAAIYKNIFKEDIGDTLGEAFSILNGKFRWHFNVFNAENEYYVERNEMSAVVEECVIKVLDIWKEAKGHFPKERNFEIKCLLNN